MRRGIPINTTFLSEHLVAESETVPWLQPGSPLDKGERVLASAVLLRLFEAACWAVIDPYVEDGESLVGCEFVLLHKSPAMPGDRLSIAVTCTRINRRDVWWRMSATNLNREQPVVATMEHRLRVISRARFWKRWMGLGTDRSVVAAQT